MNQKRKYVILSPNYNYSIILGDLYQNVEHKHFSIHLALSLKSEIAFFVDDQEYCNNKPIIIASNIVHRIVYEDDNPLMIISVSPICNMGFWLKHLLNKEKIVQLNESNSCRKLRLLGSELYNNKISSEAFSIRIDEAFNTMVPSPAENSMGHIDVKIIKALEITYNNFEEVIPAKSIAGMVNLSTSRFLHLFKQDIGITYRRMQIWMKLGHSFRMFPKATNLMDLALSCGFSDSAHYSRAFKEAFGVSPSTLLKNSQFIQGK